MQVEQARALVERDDEELAATLDVPMGPPSRALVKSLTTEMDYLPLDRKVRIAAFLARHGYIITFDGRFEKFCRSERYTQNVHATNVELHQLQDRLGLIGVEVPLADLPKEVAAFHKALLGQNPLIQDMVSHTLENETNRTFIHVGANDLRGSDDQAHHWLVRSPDWKCFLVEPQPRVFERLKKSVRDTPNVTLINAAIAAHDGTAALTVFRLDVWSTMAPRTVATRKRANEPTKTVEVQCMTAETLLRTHGIRELGFLMIDTEGLDKIILDQFLAVRQPRLIICEVAHLAESDRTSVLASLGAAGYEYRLINGIRDVLAVHSEFPG